jgi:hypothetical protein
VYPIHFQWCPVSPGELQAAEPVVDGEQNYGQSGDGNEMRAANVNLDQRIASLPYCAQVGDRVVICFNAGVSTGLTAPRVLRSARCAFSALDAEVLCTRGFGVRGFLGLVFSSGWRIQTVLQRP